MPTIIACVPRSVIVDALLNRGEQRNRAPGRSPLELAALALAASDAVEGNADPEAVIAALATA